MALLPQNGRHNHYDVNGGCGGLAIGMATWPTGHGMHVPNAAYAYY